MPCREGNAQRFATDVAGLSNSWKIGAPAWGGRRMAKAPENKTGSETPPSQASSIEELETKIQTLPNSLYDRIGFWSNQEP